MTAVAYVLPQPAPVVPPVDDDAIPVRRRRKQAWLALHFPDWPLHAALHRLTTEQRAQLITQPLVVLDEDRQRHVLVANDIAQHFGIRPGHSLNAAMALCARLKVLCRDSRAEAGLLTKLAAWAQRYTPVVSLEAPNELLLEVHGSLRLFGGVQQFIATVREALQSQQLTVVMALSPTARASLCLARCMAAPDAHGVTIVTPKQLRSAVAPLPVTCLHLPMAVQLRLRRCGVTRIGELWRLPRADLGRRIGKRHLGELDALLGKQVELRSSFRDIEPYTQRILLDTEITSANLLEPVLIRALECLQVYLRERDLALGRLHIELLHRSVENTQHVTRLCLGLATPSSDMQRMIVVLREQIAGLLLTAPVQEIKVHVLQLFAAQGVSQDLLAGITQNRPAQSQTELLACLLERLQARLGMQAVRCLQLNADYRPERAQAFQDVRLELPDSAYVAAYESASTQTLPRKRGRAERGHLPVRPLWLLPVPLMLGSGASPPVQWQVIQGPERIEAGWWDAAPIRRDYYIARHRSRACGWVFRELFKPFDWYLHGWFA